MHATARSYTAKIRSSDKITSFFANFVSSTHYIFTSPTMNKAILTGNVGRDPEMRYVGTRPVASFTLATTERAYTTAAGQAVPERTEWHNIVCWDSNASMAERYIRKGAKLLIEGKIRTRFWEDRNAIKRTVTEIYADHIEILGRPANQ